MTTRRQFLIIAAGALAAPVQAQLPPNVAQLRKAAFDQAIRDVVGAAPLRTGKVKLIAWAAETRNKALPDLPTMREAGYDVGMWGYLWFWGPGGMQPATVDAVYQHLGRAIAHPEVRELMEKGGAEVSGLAPADTARAARDLSQRWGAIIRQLGVSLD